MEIYHKGKVLCLPSSSTYVKIVNLLDDMINMDCPVLMRASNTYEYVWVEDCKTEVNKEWLYDNGFFIKGDARHVQDFFQENKEKLLEEVRKLDHLIERMV